MITRYVEMGKERFVFGRGLGHRGNTDSSKKPTFYSIEGTDTPKKTRSSVDNV